MIATIKLQLATHNSEAEKRGEHFREPAGGGKRKSPEGESNTRPLDGKAG